MSDDTALTTDQFVTLLRRLKTSFSSSSVYAKALRTTEEGDYTSAEIWRQWKRIPYAALERAIDGFVAEGGTTPPLAQLTSRARSMLEADVVAGAYCDDRGHTFGLDFDEFWRDAATNDGNIRLWCVVCNTLELRAAEDVWQQWNLSDIMPGYPISPHGPDDGWPDELPPEYRRRQRGQMELPDGTDAPVPAV